VVSPFQPASVASDPAASLSPRSRTRLVTVSGVLRWHDSRRPVFLLDTDPDLAAELTPEEARVARTRAVASVVELEPPTWDTSEIRQVANPGWLGLFLVDGLLIRRVNVGKRAACELFGPTDLIRPWDTDDEYDALPITVDWLVLRSTRLAVLDTAFVLRIAAWPTIGSRLVSYVAQRARHLALIQAVTHLPRAYARLLILFWLLADRWGKVSPDGIHVDLPLTHEVLAMLIGAHRPTVTIALQRLSRSGFLIRERFDRWLLTKAAIELLEHPESLGLVNGEHDGHDLGQDPIAGPL
jgi:CRP/FNR family transcriptional regulator, cyclic AMP receptor protein